MPHTREFRWPCEQCGAQLRFAPGQTRLICAHCGHAQSIPEAASDDFDRALVEHDLHEGLNNDLAPKEMEVVRTSRCTNCGALIELIGPKHATECPFCATPVVTGTDATRLIKPQALIPFKVSESEGKDNLTKWLGSLWFAPNKLLEYTRKGRRLNGVYVPYWTFDAQTRSLYTGQRGDAYYVTRTVIVDGKPQHRQERQIRWSAARGKVARDFDDVVVLGSNSLPKKLSDNLTPWHLQELIPYSPDYLAGFTAEGYTVTLAAASDESKAIMAHVIAQDIRRDIGGDEQRIQSVNTDYAAETFKHILLPVWMAAYKYNGKSYRFLVNGQTGEVQGERPYSVWKILFAVLGLLLLAGAFAAFSELG